MTAPKVVENIVTGEPKVTPPAASSEIDYDKIQTMIDARFKTFETGLPELLGIKKTPETPVPMNLPTEVPVPGGTPGVAAPKAGAKSLIPWLD